MLCILLKVFQQSFSISSRILNWFFASVLNNFASTPYNHTLLLRSFVPNKFLLMVHAIHSLYLCTVRQCFLSRPKIHCRQYATLCTIVHLRLNEVTDFIHRAFAPAYMKSLYASHINHDENSEIFRTLYTLKSKVVSYRNYL